MFAVAGNDWYKKTYRINSVQSSLMSIIYLGNPVLPQNVSKREVHRSSWRRFWTFHNQQGLNHLNNIISKIVFKVLSVYFMERSYLKTFMSYDRIPNKQITQRLLLFIYNIKRCNSSRWLSTFLIQKQFSVSDFLKNLPNIFKPFSIYLEEKFFSNF